MILTSINQFIIQKNNRFIHIKREDLLHPVVAGNKYRKLKYNLAYAQENQYDTLLTFGGAYSNHIAATAAAGQLEGFKTIGIIRGEELGENLEHTLAQNPTLAYAKSCGMRLHFIARDTYRNKDGDRFREHLKEKFNNPYIIPEGGTNALAIKGCEEILTSEDEVFDFVCCSAGTGGTVSGIINSLTATQKAIVFPALKGNWMAEEIRRYANNSQWEVIADYHFGGYGKVPPRLVEWMNIFAKAHKIILDPIYTAKMMYGIFDLIDTDYFPENSRILAIHTGGLQGIAGMNLVLAKKGQPLITI